MINLFREMKLNFFRTCFFLCYCFFYLQTLSAQDHTFTFLDINDGLSQNSVLSIDQDSLGRIWIATRDGLNVYDGTKFTTFRPERGDSLSLLGHFVTDVHSHGNKMFITTKNGLSVLDIKTLKFKRHLANNLNCVLTYENRIFVGTNKGLFELNQKHNSLLKANDIFSDSISVTRLYSDNSGILWIATSNGLYTYFPNTNKAQKVLDDNITTIYTDSQKRVWVGTFNNGVYLLSNKNKVLKHFQHLERIHSLSNNRIRAISEDDEGNIWIGTFLGLNIINPDNFQLTTYINNENGTGPLSHNSIYCIIRDKQDGMWVGTYFGGISYYHPDSKIFRNYSINTNSDLGPAYRVIGEMVEDKHKNLWIATEGGGLDYLNRKTNKFTHFKHVEGKPGLSHNNIKSLMLYHDSKLLIGTHQGGLNILDLTNQKFKSISNPNSNPNDLSTDIVNDIIQYKNTILIATKGGVMSFNIEQNTFTQFFPDVYGPYQNRSINCLLEDSFGNLWIGTENAGLYCYDSNTKKIREYSTSPNDLNSIGSNNIACIYEDHLYRLWVGTQGGGLNLYNKVGDNFTDYTISSHNLPSNFIQGIKESRFGNLWIATAKGLARLDVEQDKIYNHSFSTGFPLNEINLAGLYLTTDGEVFVGGLNGMVSFYDQKMLTRESDFNLFFTSLYVNNKRIWPNDDSGILSSDLPYTKKITLKHNQNVLSINFSACNYIHTNQNKYEYKLVNLNEDWIGADKQTNINYTGLPPGTYELYVRGISGVDNKVIDEKTLIIEVKKPFHKTWIATIAYIFIIFAIAYYLFTMYEGRLKLTESIESEKRDKERIKELNQSKLNFFTNISHEFRTPLTLITGTLEGIMEDSKTRPENFEKLNKTYQNIVRLNNLVTELLDFRKLEQGHLKLKVHENSLTAFIQMVYQSFDTYAQHYQINFEFTEPQKPYLLWFDQVQMEKVFYNILSNAFKYVKPKTGKIYIEMSDESNAVIIRIHDNGTGIPSDKINDIFDLYTQIDNIQAPNKGFGSGIGLALCKGIIDQHHGQITAESTIGAGTTFTVKLLKGNRHFDESVLSSDQHLSFNKSEQQIPVAASTSEPEAEENSGSTAGDSSILIVEDNLEVQQLLKDLLGKNYKLHFANDGNQGVNSALKLMPDLIISDVMMPIMEGTEMCKILKRNIQTCHIPIVLLTARSSVEYKIDGFETGADEYITKPFNSKVLKARVKNILINRQILQQKFKQDPTIKIKEVTTNSLDQKLLEQAKQIIEKHIDDTDFDVQHFANEMNLGRTRLYSKIKGVTGQTPNDFILSIRLKKAAEMLSKGKNELNVSEIAYAVGFNTPRYFSRCFRQHFGVSPSQYIKSEQDK